MEKKDVNKPDQAQTTNPSQAKSRSPAQKRPQGRRAPKAEEPPHLTENEGVTGATGEDIGEAYSEEGGDMEVVVPKNYRGSQPKKP
jgi:hypothetical protein